jgi:hypothetical protein
MKKEGRCFSYKKNKKGSHVGMMLSFALFVTFVVFLYAITKPVLNNGTDKKSILQDIQYRIVQNISTNLTTATISIVKQDTDKNCVNLSEFLLASPEFSTPTMIVKNEQSVIRSSFPSNIVSLRVIRQDIDERLLKVYHSSEFSLLSSTIVPPNTECTMKYKNDPLHPYSIDSITTGRYVFESKFYKFKTSYDLDYEKLREQLNIPPGTEFDFTFKQSNGSNVTPIKESIKPRNVYAEENPIQYIDSNANMQLGFINLEVW